MDTACSTGDNTSGHGGHCCSAKSSGSVQQSLSEMDFERGIWNAALDGEDERVRKMLGQGTDPDVTDSSGYTALHYASRNGHLSTCRILLSKGANVNRKTRSGQATALHRASYCGHLDVVKLLVDSGANVKITDDCGQTSLHKAAESEQLQVMEYLLSVSGDLKSVADKKGRYPKDCYRGNNKQILSILQT